MASSKEKKQYPPLLYPLGKSPIQKRSMNHSCYLENFGMMKDYVGEAVYDDIMEKSQVGVFLKLASSGYVWCSKMTHEFLTRQLAIKRRHEIWSLVGGRPVRFSLHEFKDITGLNCDLFDGEDKWDIDHTEFWEELGVKHGEGPCWLEIEPVLKRCRTWSFEKRRMVALLFILSVGVLGISRSSRIPLKQAKRVLDSEAFESYPWGRVGFQKLVESIKTCCLSGNSYNLRGCVHVLLIWAYESFPGLGLRFGNRKDVNEVPLLRWDCGRARFIFDAVIEEEKNEHNQVRVRHMVQKPLEEIYPFWSDESQDKDPDPKLHNMIVDIVEGNLDETAWDTSGNLADAGKKKRKKDRKRKKVGSDSDCNDDFVEKVVKIFGKFCELEKKKKYISDSDFEEEKPRKVKKKKYFSDSDFQEEIPRKVKKTTTKAKRRKLPKTSHTSSSAEEETISHKNVKNGSFEKKRNEKKKKLKVDKVENMEQEAELNIREEVDMDVTLGDVVKNIQKTKESDLVKEDIIQPNSIRMDDGVYSSINTLATLVTNLTNKIETMRNSIDARFDDVAEKDDAFQKRIEVMEKELFALKQSRPAEKVGDSKMEPVDCKSVSSDPSWMIGTKPSSKGGSPIACVLSKSKAQSKLGVTPPVQILDKGTPPVNLKSQLDPLKLLDIDYESSVERPKLGDESLAAKPSSMSTFSDPLLNGKAKVVQTTLDKLLEQLKSGDLVGRPRHLAATQMSPFEGSSLIKRIMQGVVPSKALYDPMEKVDKAKVDRLMKFVTTELAKEIDTTPAAAEFFLKIMTPKENWPEDYRPKGTFGWLGDNQMSAGMSLLRQRSLQSPSPFHNEKIAFIDPWFTNLWCTTYHRDFDKQEKSWVFPPGFIELYNGKTPTFAQTNKKWMKDVEVLYIAHNYENRHWVAVEVLLTKRKVKVYDCIYHPETDADVNDSCKPYTRMIPYLLRTMAPQSKRKSMGVPAFNIYKVKTCPQNYQTGDCGVYTLKFIECLALGTSMAGLCDAAMPAIRLKLAAEIYDEIPREELQLLSDPNPRAECDDKVPLQTTSLK